MKIRTVCLTAVLVALVALLPQLGWAQGGLADPQAIASQNLRGYNHMFIAYFIAWAIIFGWIFSIAKRLGKVEKALNET